MGKLIQRTKEALRRGRQFVLYGVWQIGKPGEEIPSGFVIKQIRVAILLGSKLLDGMHMVRASALAFATILSIVPFLAVTFFIIDKLDLGENLYALVQERLEQTVERVSDTLAPSEEPGAGITAAAEEDGAAEPSFPEVAEQAGAEPGQAAQSEDTSSAEERAPPEVTATDDQAQSPEDGTTLAEVGEEGEGGKSQELQEEIVRSLFQGITQTDGDMRDPVQDIINTVAKLAHDAATNPAALTLSGILLILTTVLGLMRNIENTFNRIWGVRRTRSWYRTFSDYIIITLLLPFVAAFALGITAALHSAPIAEALGPLAFGLRFSRYILIVLVFSLLYKLVPNTHVQFRYALLAGLIAGTMWVLLSVGYVQFQFGLARYALILSAFAQFPMLLTWIYLSWAILLLGCEVAYAYQNESTFALERFADDASYAYREAVGLRAMIETGRRFSTGQDSLTLEGAAQEWNVPMRLLRETFESLIDAGFLSACATEPVSYQPARPLDKIRAGDIITVLRDVGEEPSLFRQDEQFMPVIEELARHDDDFGGATIAELIESLDASGISREPSEPLNA